MQPFLVNENVVGPTINPFQELYYKQFGGSPTPEALNRMDPKKSVGGDEQEKPKAARKRKATAKKIDQGC